MTILGIDIGGTNIEFGILNDNYEMLYKNTLKTTQFENAKDLAKAIHEDIKDQSFKIDRIGIGAPSVNSITQSIEYPPNLNWGCDNIPLKAIFEAEFNTPVKVINDALTSALGEWAVGAAKGLNTFAMITLGTGVGIGLIINGEIYNGPNGTGGELGHVCIDRVNGRECNCGNYGCLETYIGKEGVLKTARQKIEFGSGVTQLTKIIPSELNVRDIFKLARKGDAVAIDIVASITQDLAYGISLIANAMDINHIFLSGGMAKEGNFIRKRTLKDLKPYLTKALKETINLQVSSLLDENPAIIGAAHLAKQ
jgi:glucokinase